MLSTAKAPDASVVIPTWNGLSWLRPCVRALRRHTEQGTFEVVVVDNGSDDGTAGWVEALGEPFVLVKNRENLGFARACNRGAENARGRHLVFLNNDTSVESDWLPPLVAELDDNVDVDIVGARLVYADGRIQHAGVAFSRPDSIPYHFYVGVHPDEPVVNRRRELRAVTAACMAVRRSAFTALGGFDTGYRNGFEDIDLCLRARNRGGRILYRPDCRVVHHEERTPGRKDNDRANLERFLARWRDRVFPDEDWVLAEDGYAVSIDHGSGRPIRHVTPLPPADRGRYERVARVQRALAAGELASAHAAIGTPDQWPHDPDLLAWRTALVELLARTAPSAASPPVDYLARAIAALPRG